MRSTFDWAAAGPAAMASAAAANTDPMSLFRCMTRLLCFLFSRPMAGPVFRTGGSLADPKAHAKGAAADVGVIEFMRVTEKSRRSPPGHRASADRQAHS